MDTTNNIETRVNDYDAIRDCTFCKTPLLDLATRGGVYRMAVEITWNDNCDPIYFIDAETRRPGVEHTLNRCAAKREAAAMREAARTQVFDVSGFKTRAASGVKESK